MTPRGTYLRGRASSGPRARRAAASPRGVGWLPVDPPLQGTWTFGGPPYPPTVNFLGTTFNLTSWAWPLYSGVVAQYREVVPYDSKHLFVLRNGTYWIDHVDEANPDAGFSNLLEHAVLDVDEGTTLAMGMVGGLVGFLGGMWLLRR